MCGDLDRVRYFPKDAFPISCLFSTSLQTLLTTLFSLTRIYYTRKTNFYIQITSRKRRSTYLNITFHFFSEKLVLWILFPISFLLLLLSSSFSFSGANPKKQENIFLFTVDEYFAQFRKCNKCEYFIEM